MNNFSGEQRKFGFGSPIKKEYSSKQELLGDIEAFMTEDLVAVYGNILYVIQERVQKILSENLNTNEREIEIQNLTHQMSYITEKLRGNKGLDNYLSAVHSVIDQKEIK